MITLPERLGAQGDVFRKMQDNTSNNIRVAVPAIVKSFDATKQTITAQVTIKERVVKKGEESWVSIPLLVDVPIVVPRAGNFIVTVPVTVGDECLIIFADACIDNWYESGGEQQQIDKRRHDLSDGFAIMGTWSQPNKVSDYSTDSVQIRSLDKASYVEVKDDTINIVTTKEVNVTAPTLNIQADTEVNITAPTTKITGNVETTGDLQVTGTVKSGAGGASEVGLGTHTHDGVTTGTSNTQPPNPGT